MAFVFSKRGEQKLARVAAYVESHPPLRRTHRGLPLLIGGYPIAVASDFVTRDVWLVFGFLVWVVVWAAHYGIAHYRNTGIVDDFTSGIEAVNSSFAGCIEDIAYHISGGGSLSEEQCRQKCIALLHRIKDALSVVTESPPHVSVRATLAIPLFESDGSLRHLRVWCYDETYADRRWSKLNRDWPGAPEAFETNTIKAIEDIRTQDIPGAENRKFRSVVSIPVARSRSTGKPIAIVNLDASEPAYFDIEHFIQRVLPVVLPIVHTIGLAILAKDTGDPYSFG